MIVGDFLRDMHVLHTWEGKQSPIGDPFECTAPPDRAYDPGLVNCHAQGFSIWQECAVCYKKRNIRTARKLTYRYSAEKLYAARGITDGTPNDKVGVICSSIGFYPFQDGQAALDNPWDPEQLAVFERKYETGELHETAEIMSDGMKEMSTF